MSEKQINVNFKVGWKVWSFVGYAWVSMGYTAVVLLKAVL